MYGNGNRYVIEDSTGQKMFYAAEGKADNDDTFSTIG